MRKMFDYRDTALRSLFFLLLFSFNLTASGELTDVQKEELFEARKGEVAERLKENYREIPVETKAIIQEISDYNFRKSDDLSLTRKLMLPDSDPHAQLYPVQKLRFDSVTIPMFETLLNESDDDALKVKIIWRIRDEVLAGNYTLSDKIAEMLEDFSQNQMVDPNIRRASELTLRQAAEKQTERDLTSRDLGESTVVEIPATPPAPDVEEVAQESTAPEPATEKPAEVETPDTSKEPAEQSSNWWLWLIGAVVVFGGIALGVRRKS